MPRIDGFNELPGKLAIHVYADHLPPHFHVRSPDSNAKINMSTLQVIRGRISRQDFEAATEWARKARNMDKLRATWARINERD